MLIVCEGLQYFDKSVKFDEKLIFCFSTNFYYIEVATTI